MTLVRGHDGFLSSIGTEIDEDDAAKVDRVASMRIRWKTGTCWLGGVLVATTEKGICAIFLGDDATTLRRDLGEQFPDARLVEADNSFDAVMARVIDFVEVPHDRLGVPLDPHGTPFQQRVWRALSDVPAGSTAAYSDIAERIEAPREAYAVGEACAANKIAVAIPCHRIVRKDGGLAGYRWGSRRKRALLKRESVR